MPGAYNVEAQYGIPVYGALQYAAQQDPELLLPGYAEVFSNLSNILDPLLLQCTPDSGAPEAFGAPIAASSDGEPPRGASLALACWDLRLLWCCMRRNHWASGCDIHCWDHWVAVLWWYPLPVWLLLKSVQPCR